VKNEQKAGGVRQLTLTRLAPGVTVEELRGKTEAPFDVAPSLDATPTLNSSTLEGATA